VAKKRGNPSWGKPEVETSFHILARAHSKRLSGSCACPLLSMKVRSNSKPGCKRMRIRNTYHRVFCKHGVWKLKRTRECCYVSEVHQYLFV
jgi:hypothetical protein